MTDTAPRREARSTAQLPPGTIGAARVYSIGLGQLEDGTMTVVVGKMSMNTHRYTFFVPAVDGFEWPADTSLHDLLILAAHSIGEDPETRYL